MKIAIITVAGVSSRFNKDILDEKKILKCIYYEDNPKDTLIYHLIKKVEYADVIVIVGGYKYSDLENYIYNYLPNNIIEKILMVNNSHFFDLSSGYSLYLGINKAISTISDIDEILFVEGDLDIDDESFLNVVNSNKNVLTFNYEPIYSNKTVVLYKNDKNRFCYAFNSQHGLLNINEAFECIFNSGQLWKFKDIDALKISNKFFKENSIEDNNLAIIQKYLDLLDDTESIEIIGLKHWVNCNTRDDYKIIKNYWNE